MMGCQMDYVSFEVGALVRALAVAQSTTMNASAQDSHWPVDVERERATSAVARLLENFEAATVRSDFFGERAPYNGNRKAVWAWAQVIETEAPWSALRDAAWSTRKAAEALGWDRLTTNAPVEAFWQMD